MLRPNPAIRKRRPAPSGDPTALIFVPSGTDASPCDLLYDEPIGRLDVASAREALTFAFASGDGDVFTRLLEHTPIAPSSFVSEAFAADLRLESFIQRCLPIVVGERVLPPTGSYVRRVLCAPPLERAHVELRQQVCAELASSQKLAERFEQLYLALLSLRHRLSRPSIGVQEGIERRLGILNALRVVIESLAYGFAGTSSALARLHHFGISMLQTEAYRRLCELLEYEERRAELDLRVSVGFDGRIRSFQLLERRENRSNTFYATPIGRLWTQLGLLLDGYRMGPAEILSRLLDSVFSELEEDAVFLFQLIGDMEVYLGALGLRRLAARAGLAVSLPELSDTGPRVLQRLFNPWLLAEGRPCVPVDLELGAGEHLVLVTGSNSGGKTRLLQSLCLCQLLGHAGLFGPAERAELRWATGLFASLLEDAPVDPVEGRLGTELLRIRRAFEQLRGGSMVVMDELCSGTNPSEGEELMALVLEALGELAPQAFISTHFLEFAARLAVRAPQHRYLRAELDDNEQPTFGFRDGVAASSLARRVAERLGVTREGLRALRAKNALGG